MTSGHGSRSTRALSSDEKTRLDAIRSVDSLAELAKVVDADTEHEAYFEAKSDWRDLRGKELPVPVSIDELPGDSVTFGGRTFVVHGITHADTPRERAFVREYVSQFLENGDAVYCEQGVRRMYFDDFPDVYEMDDYLWAMNRCRELGLDSHVAGFTEDGLDGLTEDISSIASEFRKVAFSLIESGSDVYGDAFAKALGDVASEFLMGRHEMSTAENFEAFTKSREAAENPGKLADLQRYYKQVMLPQPLEREWLRRHDRELELFTHARNERLAEYAVYHGVDRPRVHLVVGAAHQPGVVYYLNEYRNGERDPAAFEPADV